MNLSLTYESMYISKFLYGWIITLILKFDKLKLK